MFRGDLVKPSVLVGFQKKGEHSSFGIESLASWEGKKQMPKSVMNPLPDLAMIQCPGILEDGHVYEVKDLTPGTGACWHSGTLPHM